MEAASTAEALGASEPQRKSSIGSFLFTTSLRLSYLLAAFESIDFARSLFFLLFICLWQEEEAWSRGVRDWYRAQALSKKGRKRRRKRSMSPVAAPELGTDAVDLSFDSPAKDASDTGASTCKGGSHSRNRGKAIKGADLALPAALCQRQAHCVRPNRHGGHCKIRVNTGGGGSAGRVSKKQSKRGRRGAQETTQVAALLSSSSTSANFGGRDLGLGLALGGEEEGADGWGAAAVMLDQLVAELADDDALLGFEGFEVHSTPLLSAFSSLILYSPEAEVPLKPPLYLLTPHLSVPLSTRLSLGSVSFW